MNEPDNGGGKEETTKLLPALGIVWRMVSQHPGPFGLSLAGTVVFAGGTVLSAVVLGRVSDEVIIKTFETGEVPPGSLLWASLAVLAVAILRAFGVVARRFYAGLTGERVQRTYRRRLAEQYIGLPMEWHRSVPTGQLLAHADNDAEMAAESIHPLPFSVGAVVMIGFSLISLLLVDWALALVALGVFPLLFLVNRAYSTRVEIPASRVQAGVATVSSVAHESFDGALVVKVLGREEAEGRRFTTAAEDLMRSRLKVGYLRAAFEPFMDALPNVGIVAAVLVGVYRIRAGAMSPGELVQVASLFAIMAFPMRVFGYFLETVPPSVVANRRLQRVFSEMLPEPRPNAGLEGGHPLSLAVSDLTFSYPDGTPILERVTMEAAAGEVVAIVGSTGAGKSTLVSILAGLTPHDRGTITIDGFDLGDLSDAERTGSVSVVFQESFLFADTLAANIDLSGTLTEAEIMAAARIAKVDLFLDELPDGLETVVGERGVTLSGGQRQRVALARALARRPGLLILDDATSAIDARVEQQILSGLDAELATTTLVVAQRISTIELADRVVYLADRRVVASGSHSELLSEPGYLALVNAYSEAAQ